MGLLEFLTGGTVPAAAGYIRGQNLADERRDQHAHQVREEEQQNRLDALRTALLQAQVQTEGAQAGAYRALETQRLSPDQQQWYDEGPLDRQKDFENYKHGLRMEEIAAQNAGRQKGAAAASSRGGGSNSRVGNPGRPMPPGSKRSRGTGANDPEAYRQKRYNEYRRERTDPATGFRNRMPPDSASMQADADVQQNYPDYNRNLTQPQQYPYAQRLARLSEQYQRALDRGVDPMEAKRIYEQETAKITSEMNAAGQ